MKIQLRKIATCVAGVCLIPLLSACNHANSQAVNGPVPDAQVVPMAPVADPAPVVPGPTPTRSATEAVVPAGTNALGTNQLANAKPIVTKTFDPATLNLSTGLVELVKLAQSGVSEAVMLEFVAKSSIAYHLAADEVVYLKDLGVSDAVISAMLKKEAVALEAAPLLTNAAPPQMAAVQPPSAPAAPPPAPPAETAPAATTVVQQPVYVTQPGTTVTHQQFYDSLAPYGTWVYLDGYGYCWQPTVAVVNVDWRPYYHSGSWAYTTYGWYWNSDYTWGWGPYHYGRWFQHGTCGWMWAPGTVWGPSWVSWRYYDGYCGWAPLPPAAGYTAGVGFTYYGGNVGVSFGFGLGYSDYCFVGAQYFTAHNPHHHGVHGQHAQQIYNNSTVINNYVNGDNNTIVNRGIGREEIARHSRREIPTVAVRDMPSGQNHNARPDRAVREGNQSVIYRQTLPAAAGTAGRAPVKGPAPAVAALTRENRAGTAASLAGAPNSSLGTVPQRTTPASGTSYSSPERSGRATAVNPPASTAAPVRTAPASGTASRPYQPSRAGAAPVAPASGTQSATTPQRNNRVPAINNPGNPPVRAYAPPTSGSAPAAPAAPSAPAVALTDRRVTPAAPSSPSYTPPARSAPARSAPAPSAPSTPVAPPAARGATPSAPSYTPPARSYAAPPASPAPGYAPTARNLEPSAPAYTPPARAVPPSTPSYSPPARSAAPAAPSYTPPTRSMPPSAPVNVAPAQSPPAPAAPAYTPPSRGAVPSGPTGTSGGRNSK